MMNVSQLITNFKRSNFEKLWINYLSFSPDKSFKSNRYNRNCVLRSEILGRLLFPIVVKESCKQYAGKANAVSASVSAAKTGKDKLPLKIINVSNRANKAEGEYVDFEEIE